MLSAPRGLIATDIDGTLLDNHHNVPPENLQAIRYAQEKNVAVAIATGRFPENAHLLLADYGLKLPIIGTNGAQIIDENLQPLASHVMDPSASMAVQQLLEQEGANYFIFGLKFVCISASSISHHAELSQGDKLKPMGFRFYHGPEESAECCRHSVQKFFICDNVPFPPLLKKLQKIPGLFLTQSGVMNIEVMPEGVDKGQGLRDLAARLGVPMDRTMALGDAENDLAMLTAAAYGTAMGNASPAAKAAAKYHTDGNNEDGWAKAVIRFVDEMNR